MPHRSLIESLEPRSLFSSVATVASPIVANATPAVRVAQATSSGGVRDVSGEIYDVWRADKVPAGAGGTIEGGSLTSLGASGRRSLARKDRVSTDDRWHLGSAGKAMTSTMVGRLIELGKLDWNSTVLDVFPELAGKITSAFNGVTVWQLMTNRSGISDANVAGSSLIKLGTLKGNTMQQRAAMVPILLKTKSNGAGDFEYSNWAYALLGAMAERASGIGFENLMRKYVFDPLKMDTAGFGAQGTDKGRKLYQPRGHTSSGSARTASNDDTLPYLAPAGTMSMSVVDWAKFLKSQMGLKVGKVQLLQATTLDRLHTPYDGPGVSYAAGWVVTDIAGTRVLSHDGTNGNWYSTVQLIPSLKYAAFAVVNQGGSAGETAAYDIKKKLLDETLPLASLIGL